MSAQLANSLYWIAVICCLVAQIGIARSVWRVRREAAAECVPAPGRVTELAWVLLPATALAVVLLLTWRAMHPVDGASSASPSPSPSPSAAAPALSAGRDA